MIRFRIAALVAATGIAVASVGSACNSKSKSAGPGSITGTLAGSAVTVRDTLSATVALNVGSGNILHFTAVYLSDVPDVCAIITAGNAPKNAKVLGLVFGDFDGSTVTPPAVPGTYTLFSGNVPPSKLALATYFETDATCQQDPAHATESTSGSFALTGVNGPLVDGHGAFTTVLGESVSVTFHSTECPALATLLESTAQAPCQP